MHSTQDLERDSKNKSNILLEVENLKVYYEVLNGIIKAVDHVSFKINKGERMGLVGESGCGKSTLARSLIRLLPTYCKIFGGKIIFKGENLILKKEEEIRKIRGSKIAMIFQDPMTFLNPVIRVGDQIAEAIKVHTNVDKKNAYEMATHSLELVKMPNPSEILYYFPHQLSGGMRQRVMMAMALSCNPELIILDEPTTALDVIIQFEIIEMLKDLNKRIDITMLSISHDIAVIANLCQKIGVMHAGNLIEIAATNELLKNPVHPYTIGLMGAFPKLKKTDRLKTIKGNAPDLFNPPPGCRFHERCSFATDICKSENPKLIEVNLNHYVACHNLG